MKCDILEQSNVTAEPMRKNEEGKIEEKKPKRVYKRSPSLRMRKTAKILLEKGSKSVSSAMREAGYSENTAKVPSKVTKTQSWQSLMDQYLPQDLIARKHQELLEAEETVFIPRGNKILEKKRPDFAARKAGVDMAHKLRGNFAPEKVELSKRKFQDMSNKELSEFIAQKSAKLLKKKK